MKSVPVRKRKVEKPFSLSLFLFTLAVTLAVIFTIIALALPKLWSVQMDSSLGSMVVAFLIAHLACSCFEWIFHRYVFHRHPIWFLKHFYTQHAIHHGLTMVKPIGRPGQQTVFNRYPITEEKQYEAAYFPWHSLASFVLLSSPALAGIQLCFPHSPVVLSGILAITWSMFLYEFIHAVEHRPYEGFWKQKIDDPDWGWIWVRMYCFHQRHHLDVTSNEAVGGFFGLPVFDWLFRTYKPAWVVLHDGMRYIEQNSAPPRPVWYVRLCDHVADYLVSKQRAAPAV